MVSSGLAEGAASVLAKVKRSSFYVALRILPAAKREAMFAIYAFCRDVDDIADEPGPKDERLAELEAWRRDIDTLYRGVATPRTQGLEPAVREFGLAREDFVAIIDGMQMDLLGPIRAPDLATLDLYCDQVASAVGRLSVRAFGDASPAADQVAHALGRALQLTNILRDIQEDAERGRIYLPREYLRDAGVPSDPRAILTAPGLPAVCERLATLAHGYFRQARDAMERCDRAAMKPARLMGATYDSILSRLERRGWKRLGERVSLPKWKKLWLACRYGLF